MCVAMIAQITQNKKFAISLQYLKKEANDEVDFLHVGKLKRCYKLILWLLWWWSSTPKVPIIASFQCLYNISKKKLEMKLIFCMQINIKVSYKLISRLWTPTCPTGWYYHYWWARSSILKVLKVTSLQYLYNISKKKLRIELIICMQINIKVSTSWHYRFWQKRPNMSKVPKIGKWQYFPNILRKKYCNCFYVLLLCKTVRYFTGIQSCLLLLVFWWLWSKMGAAF